MISFTTHSRWLYPKGHWLLPHIIIFFSLHYLFGSFLASFITLAVVTLLFWAYYAFFIVAVSSGVHETWMWNPGGFECIVEPLVGTLSIVLAFYAVELFGLDYAVETTSVAKLTLELFILIIILFLPDDQFVSMAVLLVTPFYIFGVSALNGDFASPYYSIWMMIIAFTAAMFVFRFKPRNRTVALPVGRKDYIFVTSGSYAFNAAITLSFLFLFISFVSLV